jgi:hypothetical protein
MYSRLILVPWQLAACSACWLLARWLQISEIPDCPSWDGSIPAPAMAGHAAQTQDGGLGIEYSRSSEAAAAAAAVRAA